MRRPAVPTGELDREITLEFKTAGQSTSGEPTEAWGTPATVWANVRALSGREFYSQLGAQLVADETLVFVIRHRTDVRAGTARIKYNAGDAERIYNIRRVAEFGRRAGLEIYADTVSA